MVCKLDKVEELSLEHVRNVGFIHTRSHRNGHGDNAAPERTRRNANVSAAALPTWHLSNVVHSASRGISENFQVEGLAILRDAVAHLLYVLN